VRDYCGEERYKNGLIMEAVGVQKEWELILTIHVLLTYIITATNDWIVGRLGRSLRVADNGNGFVMATSTVTIASGMVMGESHLGVGVRSKKSSRVGD
jgi:hypothetical protein